MQNSQHIDFDQIARMYTLNEGDPEELMSFLLHLEGICPECDQTLLRLHHTGALPSEANWGQVLLAMSREQATELWRSVGGLRGEMLATRLKENRFATWGFVERLCEQSLRQGSQDPNRSLELARLAVALAERLPPEQLDEGCHREARAMAHAHLGNAWRLSESWSRARQEHGRAEELVRGVKESPLGYLPRILMLRTGLEVSLGRLDTAQKVLDEAFARLAQKGPAADSEILGGLWILQAMIYEERQDLEAAIEAIGQSLAILEPTGVRSRMLFCAWGQLLGLQILANRLDEAVAILPQVESLEAEVAGVTDRLKLSWQRGRLSHLLNAPGECVTHLREAQEGFLAQGLCHHAVMVTLEICQRLLEQGRVEEVKAEASRLLLVLLGQRERVAVEIMASVAMLKRASETGELNRELIDQLQGVLETQVRERRWLMVGQ